MKKFNILVFLSIALLSILMINIVNAYQTSDLKMYYGFEETSLTSLNDSHLGYNLTGSGYNWSHTIGLKLNAIKNPALLNTSQYSVTTPYYFDTSNKFSINFWYYSNGITNQEVFFTLSNSVKAISLDYVGQFRLTNLTSVYINGGGMLSGWNMYTIQYDGTKYNFYKNGNLTASSTSFSIYTNSSIFYLGKAYNGLIDEMSIWNNTLNDFDMALLYNNGFGLNYAETLATNTTPANVTPLCVDNNYLCANPLLIGGSYYCDIGQETYCSDGCINYVFDNTTQTLYQSTYNSCDLLYSNTTTKTFYCNNLGSDLLFLVAGIGTLPWNDCGISTTTFTSSKSDCSNSNIEQIIGANPTHQFLANGICSQLTSCTSECSIIGYQDCDSANTFKICQLGSDGCLHYETGFSCLPTQYCSNGQCTSSYGNGATSNKIFSVDAYSVSDADTNYTKSGTTINVNTDLLLFEQKFKINLYTAGLTTYSTRDCDYKETDNGAIGIQSINESVPFNYPVNIYSASLYPALYLSPAIQEHNTLIYEFNISNFGGMMYNGVINLTLQDGSGNNILKLSFNKSTSIFYTYYIDNSDNINNLITDAQNMAGNNLDVKIQLDFSTKTATIIQYDGLIRFTYILQFNAYNSGDGVERIVLTDENTNTNVNSVKIFTANPYTPFHLTQSGFNYLPCDYSVAGKYTVRTYLNDNGTLDYSNFKDWTVNLNTINGQGTSNANNGISQGQKYLIFFIVLFVVLAGFIILGIIINQTAVLTVIAIVMSLLWTILCAIPDFPYIGGIIPSWIAIFIIILTIILGLLVGWKFSNSDNGV